MEVKVGVEKRLQILTSSRSLAPPLIHPPPPPKLILTLVHTVIHPGQDRIRSFCYSSLERSLAGKLSAERVLRRCRSFLIEKHWFTCYSITAFTSADLLSERVLDEAFFAGTHTSASFEGARRTEDVTRQRLLGTRVVCCDTGAHA